MTRKIYPALPPERDPRDHASNLYIDVKVYGGTHCHKAIMDMQNLADRIGISVWADLNGVRTLARPGDSWAKICAAWDDAMANKRPYASASDRTDAWVAICEQARGEP